MQHPWPSARVTAGGELPPHKLLTGHCDGKQDAGSCHGSSVLSPLLHCCQEPESPLKYPKVPLDTCSIGLQVPGGGGGGDAEHRAGTGRGQCPLLGIQGPSGNSEQSQNSPRLFHLPVWPLGHLVLLVLAFFKPTNAKLP